LFFGCIPLPSSGFKIALLPRLTGRKLGIVTILRDLEHVVVLNMEKYFYGMV
jgi:hypothetical protein